VAITSSTDTATVSGPAHQSADVSAAPLP
jgi:hypothetical protein